MRLKPTVLRDNLSDMHANVVKVAIRLRSFGTMYGLVEYPVDDVLSLLQV